MTTSDGKIPISESELTLFQTWRYQNWNRNWNLTAFSVIGIECAGKYPITDDDTVKRSPESPQEKKEEKKRLKCGKKCRNTTPGENEITFIDQVKKRDVKVFQTNKYGSL